MIAPHITFGKPQLHSMTLTMILQHYSISQKMQLQNQAKCNKT